MPPPAAPGPVPRLLLVEDDASLRDTLFDLLRINGFQVDAFGLGKEALDWIPEHRPDLVLLDLHLPDMNGQELADRIADQKPPIPFIVITGQEDTKTAVEMMKRGAKDYLLKGPGVAEFLVPVIKQVCGEIRQQELLFRAELDKRLLEEKVHQAEKIESLGLLTHWIAHEFNNALAAIMGYTRLAMEDLDKQSITYANLREVFEASNRSKELVSQFLQLGNDSEPEKSELPILEVLEETLDRVDALVPAPVVVEKEFPPEAGTILGNIGQMRSLFANILQNAIEAIGNRPGVVRVRLEEVDIDSPLGTGSLLLEPGPYFRITIEDDGPGMEPATLKRIFEPFFTTRPRPRGRGMGLSVAYGIATGNGGIIEAESTLGAGSRFRIFLPRLAASTNGAAGAAVPVGPGGGRILIVDDETTLTRMGKQILERVGYEVVPETDPLRAVERIRADPSSFDLVITDLVMPGMRGDELACAILAIRPDLAIILLTGSAMDMTSEEIRAQGFCDWIEKPVLPNELRSAVGKVLRAPK